MSPACVIKIIPQQEARWGGFCHAGLDPVSRMFFLDPGVRRNDGCSAILRGVTLK